MRYTVQFLDGPCSNRLRQIEMGDRPEPLLPCGGVIYAYRGTEGQTIGGVFSGQLVYALSGGQYDNSVEQIRRERDVYKAWSKLRSALQRTTPAELRAVRRAGARVRRAVR